MFSWPLLYGRSINAAGTIVPAAFSIPGFVVVYEIKTTQMAITVAGDIRPVPDRCNRVLGIEEQIQICGVSLIEMCRGPGAGTTVTTVTGLGRY